MSLPLSAFAGVFINVTIAPPVLPVYDQPPCPQEGYIWTPGYWAWGPDGYYWVPGAWVPVPYEGALWTPGYWEWGTGYYRWHDGYWGRHVGYYGGINYGWGYPGSGYWGGEWREHHFVYNTAVTRVNVVNVHNVYINRTVINNVHVNNTRVSFNGGQGGVHYQPSHIEQQYSRESHMPPTQFQQQHMQVAARQPDFRASANHGQPPVGAVERPMNQQNHMALINASRQNFHPGNNQPGNMGNRIGNAPVQNNMRPGTPQAGPQQTHGPVQNVQQNRPNNVPPQQQQRNAYQNNPYLQNRNQPQVQQQQAQQRNDQMRVQQQQMQQRNDQQRMQQQHNDQARAQQQMQQRNDQMRQQQQQMQQRNMQMRQQQQQMQQRNDQMHQQQTQQRNEQHMQQQQARPQGGGHEPRGGHEERPR